MPDVVGRQSRRPRRCSPGLHRRPRTTSTTAPPDGRSSTRARRRTPRHPRTRGPRLGVEPDRRHARCPTSPVGQRGVDASARRAPVRQIGRVSNDVDEGEVIRTDPAGARPKGARSTACVSTGPAESTPVRSRASPRPTPSTRSQSDRVTTSSSEQDTTSRRGRHVIRRPTTTTRTGSTTITSSGGRPPRPRTTARPRRTTSASGEEVAAAGRGRRGEDRLGVELHALDVVARGGAGP